MTTSTPTATEALTRSVRLRLAAAHAPISRAQVAHALVSEGAAPTLGVRGVLAAAEAVFADISGAGVLEPLFAWPGVTDVLVNGPDEVWVDRGTGLQRVDVDLGCDADVRRLAVRLAAAAGRRLDEAAPCVDVRLPNGVRMHAVLPPISTSTHLSFRVPSRRPFRFTEFVESRTIDPRLAPYLQALVANRISFLVSGATGSGKTTLLGCLLGLVHPRERVVLVEDVPEIQTIHRHVVRLQARPANAEGAGTVSVRQLVREALRMRPDRIVIGEVRGAECIDLLAALNVGHDGCAGTLHANSPEDVPARLEALAMVGGMRRAAVHSHIAAGLRAVIHIVRDAAGVRTVSAIGIVQRRRDGLVTVEPAVGVAGTQFWRGRGAGVLENWLGAHVAVS